MACGYAGRRGASGRALQSREDVTTCKPCKRPSVTSAVPFCDPEKRSFNGARVSGRACRRGHDMPSGLRAKVIGQAAHNPRRTKPMRQGRSRDGGWQCLSKREADRPREYSGKAIVGASMAPMACEVGSETGRSNPLQTWRHSSTAWSF